MLSVFTLLIIFQFKHFICDYPLQTPYMLGKLRRDDWIMPLAAHAGVHSLGTFMIALIFSTMYLATALLIADFVLHFIVDRLKASPSIGGRFSIDNKYFWWCLGADQMAHHLINYAFIAVILYYL